MKLSISKFTKAIKSELDSLNSTIPGFDDLSPEALFNLFLARLAEFHRSLVYGLT